MISCNKEIHLWKDKKNQKQNQKQHMRLNVNFFNSHTVLIYEKVKCQLGNLQEHATISLKNLHNLIFICECEHSINIL